MAGWLGVLIVSSTGWAQSYYVEADPVATEDAAERIAAAAEAAGCPGRVVRRYLREQGWRYVFRSRADASLDAVRACVDAPAVHATAAVRLVARDGARRRVLRVQGDGGATPMEDPVAPDAGELLARALRTHRGAGDGGRPARVLFRFERRTPDGRTVAHVYARRDDERYVSTEIVDGPGEGMRAGIVDGRAWVVGHEGAIDVARTRRQLDRFSPETVIPPAASLGWGQLDLPGADRLVVGAREQDAVVLEAMGDRTEGPLRIRIDTGSWRITEIAHGEAGDRTVWRFEDWVETEEGALWPRRATVTHAGASIDDVRVGAIELAPSLPERWFVPPSG